jgi:hypothetical protein
VIDKLIEKFFDDLRLDVPIVDFLLLELIPSIPVGLDIILWQILRESVGDEKLFVFTKLS